MLHHATFWFGLVWFLTNYSFKALAEIKPFHLRYFSQSIFHRVREETKKKMWLRSEATETVIFFNLNVINIVIVAIIMAKIWINLEVLL